MIKRSILSALKIKFLVLPKNRCLCTTGLFRYPSYDDKDDRFLREDINLRGIELDDIDDIVSSDELYEKNKSFYPSTTLKDSPNRTSLNGHNVVVVQPWQSYANFDEYTDPELQLAECVSLANTPSNWRVIGKKVVFAKNLNRREVFGKQNFEEFKQFIHSHTGVTAVMLGVESLSGIQLATLEDGLKLAVYDRFTVVLNIFRHHARTKEAKIQIALAEIPYIRSHLREIHQSSQYSSTSESLKTLIGGTGESFYHKRLMILNRRQKRLMELLDDIRCQRELVKRSRVRAQIPTISVIGYTNSGKTSFIKYMTNDDNVKPEDKLFATLDVTLHETQLPSCRQVLLIDTVGFISRIPTLLIGAFSATLRDVQQSDLILHILDVSHPDHKLQYDTVIKSLKSLGIAKRLIESKITIGNKFDLLRDGIVPETMPQCDFLVSTSEGHNMMNLVKEIDARLSGNLGLVDKKVRLENGGLAYVWARKNCSIIDCKPYDQDPNYLDCHLKMSKKFLGQWQKRFGSTYDID